MYIIPIILVVCFYIDIVRFVRRVNVTLRNIAVGDFTICRVISKSAFSCVISPMFGRVKHYLYQFPQRALTVDVVVFDSEAPHDDPRVRLVTRKTKPGSTNGRNLTLPGGFNGANSDSIESIGTEMYEELGFSGDAVLDFVGVFDHGCRDPRQPTTTLAYMVTNAMSIECDGAIDIDETDHNDFYRISDIVAEDMCFVDHLAVIHAADRKRRGLDVGIIDTYAPTLRAILGTDHAVNQLMDAIRTTDVTRIQFTGPLQKTMKKVLLRYQSIDIRDIETLSPIAITLDTLSPIGVADDHQMFVLDVLLERELQNRLERVNP